MPVETDLERQLRKAFHGHGTTDGLPDRVLVDSLAAGRSSLRGHRRRAMAGSAAALAVVAGLAVAVVQRDDGVPQPAVPSPSPTPPPSAGPTIAPGAWANGLPLGDPPSVPYVAGTDVIEPDGARVDTGGTGLGIIGLSEAGLVLLLEKETEHPFSFTSTYVVVTPAGEVRELPAATVTRDAAREALVSPSGAAFTNGGDILDVRDFVVIGHIPEAASIMLAWTPTGIIYSADHSKSAVSYHVLRNQGAVVDLDGDPGIYPNGTDVGYRGCRVVRLSADGVTPISDCIDGLRSVSPSGRWALTADLRLVDVTTGESRYLAGGPVHPEPYSYDKAWWDGDDSVLIPVFAHLVRCDTATGACERATEGDELRAGRFALP